MKRMGYSGTRRLALPWSPAGANLVRQPAGRRIIISQASDECKFLREENAEMRDQIHSLIANNPEMKSQLSQHLEEHAALARLGQDVGEYIPTFLESDSLETQDEAPVSQVGEEKHYPMVSFLDKEVIMEVEGDETLVFKFQNKPAVSNNLVSSCMSSSEGKWSYSGSSKPGSTTSLPASAPAPPKKSKQDLAIETSNALVEQHDPSSVVQDKEDWLFITVPSTPVAGAKAVLYFNKEQSQLLQHHSQIELYAKFNKWELDMDTSDRIDMQSMGALIPGTNFYRAEFTIPMDAYEMNFIFGNKDGVYDNNDSQNYSLPVIGEMTAKKWIETAPERAEAEYLKRKEQERIAAEKAEKEREAIALEQDAQKAQDILNHIKFEYENLTSNAHTSFTSNSGAEIMITQQKTVRGAVQVKIAYNKAATCLADTDAENDPLMIRVGHNGWQNPVDMPMKLAKAKQSMADNEEWWEAAVKVPLDAVALNMVVFCGGTFDNNNQNDYTVFVDRGKDVAAWADSILPLLKKTVTDTRREEEKEAKELEAKKLKERQAVRVRICISTFAQQRIFLVFSFCFVDFNNE